MVGCEAEVVMNRWMCLAVLAIGCGGQKSPSLLAAPPAGEGFQVHMEFEAAPSQETWRCRVMNMPNEDLANVNRVEHAQTPGLHHMDLTALFTITLPPGDYDCGALYEAHPELMDQPTLYAAQTATYKLDLGAGVVAQVPPGLPVMFEL